MVVTLWAAPVAVRDLPAFFVYYQKGVFIMESEKMSVKVKEFKNDILTNCTTFEVATLIETLMIETLIGLETSGSYKKHERYARSSFDNYINDRFNIRSATYRENKLAFVKFPAESGEYGVGLVSKVIRCCGRMQAQKVLDKINTKKSELKTEITSQQIEKIIQESKEVKK